VKHPQPTLRCVPNGKEVSEMLFTMWREHHQAEKIVAGATDLNTANDSHSNHPQGVMA
jgi:hypothetical protein